MNFFLLVAGSIIILTAITDLFYTTFSPDGAGYFTSIITKSSYKTFSILSRLTGSKHLFELAGIITIILILLCWYFAIWLGSALIICWDPDSVINSQTQAPASITEKFYYMGFTISTLGMGDYVASSDGWRIFTVLLSFSGFVLITTGISYMLPVLSATVNKRRLGSYISLLGETPQAILKNHWQDGKFGQLESYFDSLTSMINLHTQQLLAYPVVYCFYTANPRSSGALNIAKMDEALTILLTSIPQQNRPSEQSMFPLRSAILEYLITQRKYFIKFEPVNVGYPRLDELKEVGIPVMHKQDEVPDVLVSMNDRRELMAAILAEQNRSFGDIYGERFEYELKL